ncbi:MAG: hypothetical protein MOGMAGMI_00796 [Candidatus Omnitrophica bacterium]|nr:hypothetical protein [Candidatus Omnitrophota bacterium]
MRIPTLATLLICLSAGSASCPEAAAGSGGVSLRERAALTGVPYRYDAARRLAWIGQAEAETGFLVGSRYVWVGGRLRRLNAPAALAPDGMDVRVPVDAEPYLPAVHPAPKSAGAAAPERAFTVMVDPGHGGKDPGAKTPDGGLEKDIALRISLEIAAKLRERGLRVLMTRRTDEWVELERRPQLANEHGADLLVSVHANASESPSLGGFEIYYLSEEVDDTALAESRARDRAPRTPSGAYASGGAARTIVWDLVASENRRRSAGLAEGITREVGGAVTTEAQRVRQAQFRVLKLADCPAVLVEAGYLTHDGDQARLTDPEYLGRLTDAIVAGLGNYIDTLRSPGAASAERDR